MELQESSNPFELRHLSLFSKLIIHLVCYSSDSSKWSANQNNLGTKASNIFKCCIVISQENCYLNVSLFIRIICKSRSHRNQSPAIICAALARLPLDLTWHYVTLQCSSLAAVIDWWQKTAADYFLSLSQFLATKTRKNSTAPPTSEGTSRGPLT